MTRAMVTVVSKASHFMRRQVGGLQASPSISHLVDYVHILLGANVSNLYLSLIHI